MIQLLFTVISIEMGLILILMFKTPLRKVVIMSLDRVKRGRGPVVVKTIGGTVFIVLMSSVYSILKIQKRSFDSTGGVLNSTDQVLFSKHLLEASLMGFSLFLALMIDRLHHYIRELRMLRKNMEAVKKQNRAVEDGKSSDLKNLEEEVAGLKTKVKQLESDSQTKVKAVEAAEANALALKKQSEGFLLEYDRLLEENQNLRNQLQSIDQMLSHSDSKKSS
ncbi:hypothetical protein IFM89_035271 [Coptis chinensis]|uniref:Endoplasmic reticulum transmembrane protein n=1 Tax=Coptis chinensis TaxID=261450 RepID=A0A835H0Q9_9MAGN|nr:hypothetical protein IFM89_035271 [Coptis chinensis]